MLIYAKTFELHIDYWQRNMKPLRTLSDWYYGNLVGSHVETVTDYRVILKKFEREEIHPSGTIS